MSSQDNRPITHRMERKDGVRARSSAAITLVAVLVLLAAGLPAAGVGSAHGLQPSGRLVVTVPGTVIDRLHVTGSIEVRADNVAITNTVVTFAGYHSIRIHPGVTGTTILDTEIRCESSRTNGIVFGNYRAERVVADGCRNAFMYSDGSPAVIIDSFADGVPVGSTPDNESSEIEPVIETPEDSPEPQTADPPSTIPVEQSAGVPDGVQLTASGDLHVTEDGAIIDGLHVTGSIDVYADGVTIRNTLVTFAGYHSVRIHPGATGTTILDTEIQCERDRTNGIVFGDYRAERVVADGCRNAFMYSDGSPAVIIDSFADGEPVEATTEAEPDQPAPQLPSTFPNEQTTGVPDGVELTPSGTLNVTEDGAVVDGLHVQGTIFVRADNVTIRNTLVDTTNRYPIFVDHNATGLVVEDSEIDGNDRSSIAILFDNYTLRRVNIHSVLDGPRIEGDNVTIVDSYIHDLSRVPGGHHDAIQIRSGSNILIQGNTLMPYKPETGDALNAAIQIGSLIGPISSINVIGNYMNGGNYTLNGAQVPGVVQGNAFGRDYRYGIAQGSYGPDRWKDNYWLDDKTPAVP